MARFYGTVHGGRGVASRLGHATSGLDVTAQSNSGDVTIRLYDQNGEDYVCIGARGHMNRHGEFVLYDGPVADLLDRGARIRLLKNAVLDELLAA